MITEREKADIAKLRKQADAINGQLYAIEKEADKVRATALIGRCFKYHNSFGDEGRWWLYAKITGFNEYAHLHAFKFQHTCKNVFDVEVESYIGMCRFPHDSGWKSITPEEFEAAKAEFFQKLALHFTK